MSGLVPFGRNRNRDLAPVGWVRSIFHDTFFTVLDREFASTVTGIRPDLKDKGNEYIIEAELPGVERDKINLEVHRGVLTISANDDREVKEERDGYVYRERRTGTVSRSFDLDGVNEEGIRAEFKNGILSVHLPKTDATIKGVRKIDIS